MTPLFSSTLLRTQSDERLLLLVREGQERAFEAIVDRYRRPLQRYCERALSRSRAEDVVQQVLMKAWLALRNGTEVRSLRPWLYGIARTTMMLDTAQAPGYDYAELRGSLLAPDDSESELEQRTVIRKTLTGLAALPEAQREALMRTAFEGQSRAQIAEALGVSEGAVRQLLYRARASLRVAATAVTPLHLANWLATIGQSSVGTALESGATGSIGIAGIAKASAILATAGVVVTGSAGVRNDTIDGAKQARAESAKKAEARPHRTAHAPVAVTRAVSRPAAVRSAPAEAHRSSGNEDSAREIEHSDSRASEHSGEGDSQRASGETGREITRPEHRGSDESQAESTTPPSGDSHGDEGDSPEAPDSPGGSGDSGD